MSFKRIVLIVDEQDEVLEAIEKSLQGTGQYKVLKAKNENDAFEMILDDFIDVLISDLSLTKDKGLALLEKVVELPLTDRPIIYILAPDQLLSKDEVKRYGIHKVIETPFKYSSLLNELDCALLKYAA